MDDEISPLKGYKKTELVVKVSLGLLWLGEKQNVVFYLPEVLKESRHEVKTMFNNHDIT